MSVLVCVCVCVCVSVHALIEADTAGALALPDVYRGEEARSEFTHHMALKRAD